MKEWASVTLFKFIRVKTVAIADIHFSFMRGDHGDGLAFDGPEPKGGVAHSFPPPDGRVHFDAAQKWSGRGERDGFDIETVGLHELGHVLGLGHSGVQGAVMYPVISHGERKHLHEDDVKGVKTLYKLK
ncbi:Metalloendoproteinase 3-MMP [Sesamum alatum]|uniref:Metalloendoproteinase 3-MMP n=1 Tax=Sesamum alatum TaxID=300844 RepID=A0AAE2CWL9_9LAMI|nr:Metalloendoproteinase 3-MMP [Sesamum alatum]